MTSATATAGERRAGRCAAQPRSSGRPRSKENAAPTWKKTFGFHPLTAFADHGAGAAGEALAIMLRPRNAGPDTAAEHIEVARLALAQLPRRVLIRTGSAGGTPGFLT
jgi:hypothetical protein